MFVGALSDIKNETTMLANPKRKLVVCTTHWHVADQRFGDHTLHQLSSQFTQACMTTQRVHHSFFHNVHHNLHHNVHHNLHHNLHHNMHPGLNDFRKSPDSGGGETQNCSVCE
jgi:hypothetical protein